MARSATAFYWKARQCFATDCGGRRTVLIKGPKTKLNRELALQQMALLLGKQPARRVPDQHVTVAALIDHFLVVWRAKAIAGEIKQSTVDLFYAPNCALLKAECGHWEAASVNEAMVRAYRGRLKGRGLKQNTIKNRLSILATVLRWAHRTGELFQPVHSCIPCLARQRRQQIPTADELRTLIEAAPPEVRDVLVTLLHTPLRPGDCYAMRRSWVDLSGQLLRLRDSKTGPRLVPITPAVIEVLRRRLDQMPDGDGYVFTTQTGRPWRIKYFARQVQQIRQRKNLGDHLVTYGARHFWATTALLNGCELAVVRALRGDKSITTTLHYEHIASHSARLRQAAHQAIGMFAVEGG